MENENLMLEQKLSEIKEMMDNSYTVTKNKYGMTHANHAVINYFINYKTNEFTRDENARANMQSLMYRPNENIQILLDYAISSFILNEMEPDISFEELSKYVNDQSGILEYNQEKAIQIIAIVTGMNPYHALNVLSMNPRLKSELIISFVTERYAQNKKQELDNSKKGKITKIEGYDKPIMISKRNLNNAIRNMNSDDEYEEYIVPTRTNR